jgi:hypothetical protein
MTKTIESYTAYLASRIETYQAEIRKFADKLVEDPAHHFEWADSAMKTAADLKVCLFVQNGVKRMSDDHSVEEIEAEIRRIALAEAMRRAGDSSHSTSDSHNTMQRYLLNAWARWAEASI